MTTTGNRGPLRVLCLNYEYPPVGGGGGRVAHQINAGLVARGHAVRVHTAGLRHLPAQEVVDGVEIFRSASFRKKEDTCTVPEMALYIATNILPTIGHIRKWKPDVIHAHFAVPTGVVAWNASLLTRVPYVLTAHLGDVPGGVPEQTAGLFRLVEPFTRPIWKRAAAITAVSTFVSNLAERAYGRKPRVILNGVPIDGLPEIHIHAPPRIVMAGRLSTQKNPILAIRALGVIRDLDWRFDVIGDGPLRPAMEAEAAAAGISDRVRFRGWQDASTVRSTMADADILLLTSHSEGLPMAAIEALSHGLAIVSTRIDGVTDVLRHGENGFLCEPSPTAVAEGLRMLLESSDTLWNARHSAAARAPAFDIRRSVEAYEDVLSRAAASTGGGVISRESSDRI